MKKSTKGNPTLMAVTSLGAALLLVMLTLVLTGIPDPTRGVIRAAGLLAYLCVFLASLASMFMREIVKRVGQPFMKVHHTWVIAGLVGMIVHTLLMAWRVGSLSVYLPRFDSLEAFLSNGGRPALIFFALTSLTAVFRAAIGRNWKVLHWFNYLAFLFVTAHAWLIGTSFESWVLRILGAAMAVGLIVVFVLRRARKSRSRQVRR